MRNDHRGLIGNGRCKKRLAVRGEDWFWHILALALGGRTIAEWQSTMTQPEFLSWWAFHELYPFDDFSRFHRPAALIANSFAGRDIKASLQWLMAEPKQAPAPGQRHYSDVELSLIRAIGGSSKTVISKASRKKKG